VVDAGDIGPSCGPLEGRRLVTVGDRRATGVMGTGVRTNRGLTLIELVVVLAVLAILASMAYPSFVAFVIRSNRSEARAALMDIQLAQERHRMRNDSYAATLSDLGIDAQSERGYYELEVTAADRGGFTATATAVGRQANDIVACRTMTLTITQGNESRTPGECW